MSHLDKILASTKEHVAHLRRSGISGERASDQRDFAAALRGKGISLIAEIKRRSPSAGALSEGLDPSVLAGVYADAGARAISVLTEPEFFGGSQLDFIAAKKACHLPVLRKDFIIDTIQVDESVVMGADAVLLIVSALDQFALKELHAAILEAGMTALVEIHDAKELDEAMSLEPGVIGVNQRDLTTFEIDRGLALALRPMIPNGVAVVAESGISTRDQVRELQDAGVDGILVGETLIRSADPASAINALLRD